MVVVVKGGTPGVPLIEEGAPQAEICWRHDGRQGLPQLLRRVFEVPRRRRRLAVAAEDDVVLGADDGVDGETQL